MISKILIAATFVVPSVHLCAQAPTGTSAGLPVPEALAELIRVSPWPHIGSPPAETGTGEWQQGGRLLAEAIETLKQSWTGEVAATPQDLRSQVGQYEGLLKTVTVSGGYGNLILADCLRRLSITLLTDYLLTHPAEHDVVAEILASDRVRLLDSPALRDTLSDELKLQPLTGQWRLSEKRADLEAVFSADGSTYQNELGRMLLGRPTVSKMMAKRDVKGLLIRLVEDESTDRVSLAGFAEFLNQGGRLEDVHLDNIRPFLDVMEKEQRRFQFPSMGINMLRVEQLDLLLQNFNRRGGRAAPFAVIIGQ
jgi:hypothetical protein